MDLGDAPRASSGIELRLKLKLNYVAVAHPGHSSTREKSTSHTVGLIFSIFLFFVRGTSVCCSSNSGCFWLSFHSFPVCLV